MPLQIHLETHELMLAPQHVQSIPMATCSNKDGSHTVQQATNKTTKCQPVGDTDGVSDRRLEGKGEGESAA